MSAMPQKSVNKDARREEVGDELADRLDALTLPLAQSVLGRAVELDAEETAAAEAAAETMDYETLREVALEAGISEKALKRALLEELDTETDHNATPVQRVTAPDTVRGGLFVSGALDDVIAKIEQHLDSISPPHRHPQAKDPNTRFVVTANGQPVEVRTITQANPNRQLIQIDVDTKSKRVKAWQVLIGGFILFALFGSWIGPLLFFGVLIAGIAGMVSFVKRIVRSARRTVNKALSAVSGDEVPPAADWLELWERSQRR
jgi:hypothetical protein